MDSPNFVIKLKLSCSDGTTQIRRILLQRLVDETSGDASYEKLVDAAIRCAFPERQVIIPADYSVVLTYYDVDNDCVTIASTEELMDAVGQFHGQSNPVLRITTEVHCTNRHTPLPDMDQRGDPVGASTGNITTGESGTTTTAAVTNSATIKALVETFVSLMAAAVAAMQLKVMYGGANTNSTPPVTDEYSKEIAAAALLSMDVQQAKELNETAEKLVREVIGNGGVKLQAPTSNSTTTNSNSNTQIAAAPVLLVREQPPVAVTGTAVSARAAAVADAALRAAVDANTQAPDADEGEPFIHGRHTCDGCLATPIVGVRYHSTNLPDYDLCSKCRCNYKGDEIKFQPEELDRDRPFQDRWRRKRARWAARRGSGADNGRRGSGRRRGSFFNQNGGRCSSGQPQRGSFQNRRGVSGGATQPSTAQPHEDALQEAIRRSLEDAERADAEQTTPTDPPEAPVVVPPRSIEPHIFATVAVTATAAQQSSNNTEATTDSDSDDHNDIDEDSDGSDDELMNAAIDAAFGAKPAPNGEIEMKGAEVVSDDDSSDDEKEEVKENPFGLKAPPVPHYDDDSSDDEEEEIVVPPVGKILLTPVKAQASAPKPSPAVTEFTDDAADSGSVAFAIGQTLDKCANAIDEMMDEIKRDVFPDVLSVETDIRTEVSKALGNAAAPAAAKETTQDEKVATVPDMDSNKIVDGEEDDIVKEEDDEEVQSNKSEDEWQVVSPKSEGDNEADDGLARAAQMVGSALFESDLRSSVASVPSSVPTVNSGTGSDIAPVVLDRWSAQLGQLKELGFSDEKLCVDILERLGAANIGVGEDDEVTVTQVVNELLKYSGN